MRGDTARHEEHQEAVQRVINVVRFDADRRIKVSKSEAERTLWLSILALNWIPVVREGRQPKSDGWHTYGSYIRFLARLGVVVLNKRALLVLRIWGFDVRHCIERQRPVDDTAFILDDGLFCVEYNGSEAFSTLFREFYAFNICTRIELSPNTLRISVKLLNFTC